MPGQSIGTIFYACRGLLWRGRQNPPAIPAIAATSAWCRPARCRPSRAAWPRAASAMAARSLVCARSRICAQAAVTKSSVTGTIRAAGVPSNRQMQPCRGAIVTGTPCASASSKTNPNDSMCVGKTKTSIVAERGLARWIQPPQPCDAARWIVDPPPDLVRKREAGRGPANRPTTAMPSSRSRSTMRRNSSTPFSRVRLDSRPRRRTSDLSLRTGRADAQCHSAQ